MTKNTFTGLFLGSVITSLTAGVLTMNSAYSQEEEDYIGKLESRLMALEQKLYSSTDSSRRVIPEGLSGSEAVLADLEIRMMTLEEESQKLYGAVEELSHLVRDFAKQTDMMTKDFDMRLADIENGAVQMKSSSEEMKKEIEKAKNSDGNVPEENAKKPKKTAKKMDLSFIEADMDPDTVYNKAYNFLMATAYDDAAKWMQGFIEKFPSHELSDNAHYWLGEIYLVEGDLQKAVVSFTTGLQKFPDGVKAPANLLKMGVAFKRLDKLDFARSSWNKLVNDYPNAPEAEKAKKELDKLLVEATKH